MNRNRTFEEYSLQTAPVTLKAFPTQLTLIRFTMKLMLRIPEKSVDW